MATIKCKGLTGVTFDLTVTMGSTTMNGLTALAQAIEGNNITTAMYGEISAAKDPSINQTNDGAKTLTAAGLIDGDIVICTPADDPATLTKEARADQKAYIAEAKRKGLAAGDTAATYYRTANVYDKTLVPNPYEGDAYNADDDENTAALVPKRPWTISAAAAPLSIASSVDGATLAELQIWYDGADESTYVPSATDEQGITQWTDKSSFAHNANPYGGISSRPSFENTSLQNGNGYLEFTNVQGLDINPVTWAENLTGATIFVVADFDDSQKTGSFQDLISTSSNDFGIRRNWVSNEFNVTMNSFEGDTGVTVEVTAETIGWQYLTMVYNGGGASNSDKLKFRANGSDATINFGAYTVPTSTSSSITQFSIGAPNAGRNGWTGYIGEVIIFTKTLTAIEYANVENYLKTKWDI